MLDSSDKFKDAKQLFFDRIVLKDNDRGREVCSIRSDRQKKNVDVMLEFEFKDNGQKNQVLFEDKTDSSYHNGQLEKYKNDFPNCYRYIYFKLAYINSEEKKHCNIYGYDFLSSSDMAGALKDIQDIHPLVKMYYEYITSNYSIPIASYETELFQNKKYHMLHDKGLQAFLCDKIANNMNEQDYYIEYGSNPDGRPWTEIKLKTTNRFEYETKISEGMFWRVDIRQNKYYLRLNLYSTKPISETHKKLKNIRLRILQKEALRILEQFSNISAGSISPKGNKEREIIIFFLEENNLDELIKTIPSFTNEMVDIFNKLPTIQEKM